MFSANTTELVRCCFLCINFPTEQLMLQISDNYNLLLYTDCLCAADAVLITEGLNIEMNWEGMTQANSDVDLAPPWLTAFK